MTAPRDRDVERPRADLTVEADRRRQQRDVERIEPLGLVQMTARKLRVPRARVVLHARRPRIEARPLEVETIFIRLFAAKHRRLERHGADCDASANHARA